jgi:hypothetical protein
MFGVDDWNMALEPPMLIEQQAIDRAFAAAACCEIERRAAVSGRISEPARKLVRPASLDQRMPLPFKA